MSQNPYATFGEMSPAPQARTSMLAISSLVCSLICCLPGLSILGTLLGAAAVFRISASNGRRRGLGLAIAGIVIGLMVSVCYIGAWALTAASIKQMMGVGNAIVENLSKDDAAALRAKIPADRAALLTDERWKKFKAQIDTDIGTVGGLPDEPISYIAQTWSGFRDFGQAAGRHGRTQTRSMNSSLPPMPMKGTKGKGVMFVELDGDPSGNTDRNLSILHEVIVFTSGGKIVRLFEDIETPPDKSTSPAPTPTPPGAPASPRNGAETPKPPAGEKPSGV
ncbi:MAG: DUF4190 domain-containing protein [Phycisphaerales bacterium]